MFITGTCHPLLRLQELPLLFVTSVSQPVGQWGGKHWYDMKKKTAFMHEYYPSLLFLHLTSADLIACKGNPGTHMAVEHRGWRSVESVGGISLRFAHLRRNGTKGEGSLSHSFWLLLW